MDHAANPFASANNPFRQQPAASTAPTSTAPATAPGGLIDFGSVTVRAGALGLLPFHTSCGSPRLDPQSLWLRPWHGQAPPPAGGSAALAELLGKMALFIKRQDASEIQLQVDRQGATHRPQAEFG
jgi:hypothetical protein